MQHMTWKLMKIEDIGIDYGIVFICNVKIYNTIFV